MFQTALNFLLWKWHRQIWTVNNAEHLLPEVIVSTSHCSLANNIIACWCKYCKELIRRFWFQNFKLEDCIEIRWKLTECRCFNLFYHILNESCLMQLIHIVTFIFKTYSYIFLWFIQKEITYTCSNSRLRARTSCDLLDFYGVYKL